MASSFSLGVNFFVLEGKSGKMNPAQIAHPMVAAPSMIYDYPSIIVRVRELEGFKRTNNHRQPLMPYLPSILPVMAPARIPPKAPDRTAAEMYTANLFDCSFFLYHEEIINRIPGAKPASKIPTMILKAKS